MFFLFSVLTQASPEAMSVEPMICFNGKKEKGKIQGGKKKSHRSISKYHPIAHTMSLLSPLSI